MPLGLSDTANVVSQEMYARAAGNERENRLAQDATSLCSEA